MVFYSKYNYKITPIISGQGYSWLFLPGGPGLGSEYLDALCRHLQLPGAIYRLDFPQDGVNICGKLDFDEWRQGLVDVLQSMPNPILVAHSFSGMIALTTPELDAHLSGLVLMNTTTRNSFFEQVSASQQKYRLPDLVPAAISYHLAPSSQTYREFWNTYKHYCFTAKELALGEEMIKLFAFNNKAYHYAIENFYNQYICQWIPQVPSLTVTSEYDYICPPNIFLNDARFQKSNIVNRMIKDAGHCPWVLQLGVLQDCFNCFLDTMKRIHERSR